MCQFDVVATSYLLYLLFQICYTVAIIVAKVAKENVHMLQLPQSVIQKKCLNWKLRGLQTHFVTESTHSRLSFSLVSLEGAFNIKFIKNSWQWTNLMVTYYNIVWFAQRCINYMTSKSHYRLAYLLWLLESDSFDRNKFLNSHS